MFLDPLVVLILSIPTVVLCLTSKENQGKDGLPNSLMTYTNLEELLDYVKKDADPMAGLVMETFNRDCNIQPNSQSLDQPEKFFIVVEGNHRRSRKAIARGLAYLLRGRYIDHPAPCLQEYHRKLYAGSALRRAYFHLSLYALANYAKLQSDRIIVMNGYWTEQLVFTIAHSFPTGDLPPITSEIFKLPEDLLQPDLILYLDYPDSLVVNHVNTRSPQSWKPRTLQVMRLLQDRLPIKITQVNPMLKSTTEEIYRYVYQHFHRRLFSDVTNSQGMKNVTEETEMRQDLGLYRNLNEVIDIFRRDQNPISNQILEVFQNTCLYAEDPGLPIDKRKPFIVIEGNHRPSKEAIGLKLTNLLDGRYISQVVPCLRKFTSYLKSGDRLRRPLQFLSLYVSAFEARVQMALNRAVVVNGYWTEQLSFTVTRTFHVGALPPITAEFFEYPEDLMAPDIHVFLDFGDDLHSTTAPPAMFYRIQNVRKNTNLKKRKLELYRHLQKKLPIHIHELKRISNWRTATMLLEQIRNNLSDTRDFDYRPRFNYDEFGLK